jgi:hypothetical protein
LFTIEVPEAPCIGIKVDGPANDMLKQHHHPFKLHAAWAAEEDVKWWHLALRETVTG